MDKNIELIVKEISSVGSPTETINATFSPQFLALLSEHLYSSPNKAFEELISNSWDADATDVYVRIPQDLTEPSAAIWILDNGESMNVAGFQQLWAIADSQKRNVPERLSGRKQIGKFGIGKLATYVLCNELTYICKANDGIIRVVTMDYRRIEEAKSKHLDQLPLSVRQIDDIDDLNEVLNRYDIGKDVVELIKNNVPKIIVKNVEEEEFGGPLQIALSLSETWTLAVLTSLKNEGQNIQEGWIKRLLSTALPLGSTIKIEVNKDIIRPSKSNKPVQKVWKLGPDLDFDSFEYNEVNIDIEKFSVPYPHIKIQGLGELTGTVTLFQSNIRGGKSDEIGASNGFFVNVLGRVINAEDNQFKMSDLNHSTLAQFRAAIRVDGLDKQISANREAIAESEELKIVRAFLRKLFNLGRREFGKIEDKKFETAGLVKKNDFGNMPIAPLTQIIQSAIDNNEPLPPFVHLEKTEDQAKEKEAWAKATKDDLSKSIGSVEFRDEMPQEQFVKYDLKTKQVVINKNHPFTKENTYTTEQINTLKDTAIVDILTDAYILNCGISIDVYNDILQHRDRTRRLIAQIRRNSAAQIIATLNAWKADAKPFEHIVGDAFEYLGFNIEVYGNPGEPEGVGTAFVTPTEDDTTGTYTFTYDAKSTKHPKAKTSNLNMATLARHKKDYNANYAIVVAPDYQEGALEKEALENKITPMKAKTLAKLVSLTVGYGPINLNKLKNIFDIYTPTEIDNWVDALELEMKQKSFVDIKILVTALESLVTKNKMDILGCDAIAQKYRELINSDNKPTRTEIAQVFRGLSLISPNSVYIDPVKGFDVFLFTPPNMLIQEIKRQTSEIPNELKLGAISE